MRDFKVGTIIIWENSAIPSGWAVCNGTNGTPDLRDRFIMGAKSNAELRLTGGAAVHKHTLPNTNSRAAHNHGGSCSSSVASSGNKVWTNWGSGAVAASPSHGHSAPTITINGADSHGHSTPDTDNTSSMPLHIKRVFIMKIA